MSDVSVVLLTVGEGSTARARESVLRQTLVPAEVVEVRGVRPFHRALNEGAKRVTTPFFIQVDADMELDATCVETLRRVMDVDPSVGVAVGFLRDQLMGRVSGVRMFRRACFEHAEFRDSISPDTDFLHDIRRAGWCDVYILRPSGDDRDTWHTLGDHRPDYEPAYTYQKHFMEGARYCHRGDAGGLRWHVGQLAKSAHPSAPIARIAMLQGALSGETSDLLGRGLPESGFAEVEAFMQTTARSRGGVARAWVTLLLTPGAAFRACAALGRVLRIRKAYPTFAHALQVLAASGLSSGWVAQAGLCRGLLGQGATSTSADVERLRLLNKGAAPSLRERVHALRLGARELVGGSGGAKR